jgi:hypothetical protein
MSQRTSSTRRTYALYGLSWLRGCMSVVVALAALDEALARNALESGTLLIIHRRPQPARAHPDPRLSQTRTPGGHDITVLTC